MKLLCSSLLLVLSVSASAQSVIDVSKNDVNVTNLFYAVGGEPFVRTKFTRLVEGTPYFKDEWMTGSVVMPKGAAHNYSFLKLDLFENQVHYKNEANNEMVAVNTIKEIVLTDSVKNRNYRFIHSSFMPNAAGLKKGWYHWLHSGTVPLYKFYSKTVSENKPYGSATTEQVIRTDDHYYVLLNNSLLEIKKLKEAPSVLTDKKSELEAFLKAKDNKSLSMDERMTALISFYNTLLIKE